MQSDELPFLVTHWLSSVSVSDAAAQERIRLAARELSEAFASVGAFGQSALSSSASSLQPATFSQARLQRTCPPQQLLHLVQSARLVEATESPGVNLLEQAAEKQRHAREGRTATAVSEVERVVEIVTAPFQCPEHPGMQRQTQTTAESSMKEYMELRDKIKRDDEQIRTMERSVLFQTNALHDLEQNPCSDVVEQEEKRKACERVLTQLERPLQQLVATQQSDSMRLHELKQNAASAYQQFQHVRRHFHTPVASKSFFSRIQRPLTDSFHKTLLQHRLDHAATINTHLSYPVYCLQFDKTGRYFCTGADDFLVRVFCVDPALHRSEHHSKIRGAVLVCTLRGHAGVINNIDISPDNAFLATASEDGDCRVWGLVDGSPVAILRGHTGGTNTVVWTGPYRLVTAGSDGWARCWDIRHACLKRYGKWVDKRLEYHQKGHDGETNRSDITPGVLQGAPVDVFEEENELPIVQNQPPENAPIAFAQVPLPPLPRGNGLNVLENNNNGNDENAGEFAFNDNLDEGVELLSKLPHGNPNEARTRSSSIKVLCVAKCPFGLHFATGSDDGTCRIWKEEPDPVLEMMEGYSPGRSTSSSTPRDQGELLLTLSAHHSAITDLSYSHEGDRLLSASQKEGVVRIWSWSVDPSYPRLMANRKTCHILIQLSNPRRAEVTSTRRRSPPVSRISCDVASWTAGDQTIITSQSELEKQSGSAIVIGSQFICLWDSNNGNCLVAISGAHSMQCPVLVPHPLDATILCSAGADGRVKVWSLTSGKCLFEHKNTLEFGPIDARDKGKPSGYLDGSFSPDGTFLVLTDDSGRVSVFDCLGHNDEPVGKDLPWMREQYFSNDYYDLLYDQNGYCVERGSEQPPHLAPRGVRCSNAGTPWADFVNELFKGNTGPAPCPEIEARWNRQFWRKISAKKIEMEIPVRGNIISRLDPDTTILIGEDIVGGKLRTGPAQRVPEAEVTPRSPHRMSDNYRWRDYSDILREEASDRHDDDTEMADADDDEEFDINETAGRRLQDSSDSDNDDEHEDSFAMPDSPETNGRQRRRTFLDDDSDSEGGLEEYMSTNNEPSGPFIRDYDSHFFRVPDSRSALISRSWVRRLESNSSYGGRRSYTPQVGDSIIYIPRVHKDTILQFPSLTAPWRNWPDAAEWPIVRCSIRNIRYRFPLTAYSGRGSTSRCTSVVAILTLEITGIPEIIPDRRLRWPKPVFVEPAQSHIFEINLFENAEADYVYPASLYEMRLNCLEAAITSGREMIETEVYYKDESRRDDCEWTPFPGRIVGVTESDDEDERNINGSGYRSVSVLWNTDERENVSPWELSLRDGASSFDRPTLTEAERRKARDAIGAAKEMEMGQAFADPVNEQQFSDYQSRVEVPMCFNFMLERLESDFYCSLYSVVADVKLIKENCIKYNGEVHDLSDAAREILMRFEEAILPTSELEAYRFFQSEVPNVPPAAEPIAETAAVASTDVRASANSGNAMSLRSAPVRRTSTRHLSRSTSLEALPPPQRTRSARNQNRGTGVSLEGERVHVDSVGEGRRQSRRIRIRTGDVPRTLEDLASGPLRRGGRAQNRGGTHRTLRASIQPSRQSHDRAAARVLRAARNRQEEEPESRPPSRRRATQNSSRGSSRVDGRSSRSTSEHISYEDQPSDVDLSDNDASERPSRERHNREVQQNNPGMARRVTHPNISDSNTAINTSTRTRSGHVSYAFNDQTARVSYPRSQFTEELGHERRERIDDVPQVEVQSSPRAARLARRTRSARENVEDPNDCPALPPRNRNTRQSRATFTGSEIDENDSISPSRGEEDIVARQTFTNAKPDEESHSENTESSESIAPAKTRASRRKNTSKEESEDDDVVDDAYSSDDDEDSQSDSVESVVKKPNSRNSKRARRAKSYHNESEEESEASEDVSIRHRDLKRTKPSPHRSRKRPVVEETRPRRPTRSQSRNASIESNPEPGGRRTNSSRKPGRAERNDPSDQESPPVKKPRKGRSSSNSKAKKILPFVPSIAAPWPEIEMKWISQVTCDIIDRLRAFDDEKLFEEPVTDQYPDIADSYNMVIEKPMDFRTIEEGRLLRYRSIRELQQDLMLVFNNCIVFNQDQVPEFANKARQMQDMLKDVFTSVCQELDVLLPRRW